MKIVSKTFLPLLIILTLMSYINSRPVSASLINPSFEDGFNQWDLYEDPITGDASVVSVFDSFTPVDGSVFLRLSLAGEGYDDFTSVAQEVALTAGETIGGVYGYEAEGEDILTAFGRVLIIMVGPPSDIVYDLRFGNVRATSDPMSIPWTGWSFTPPTTGLYWVSYVVGGAGDYSGDITAVFDAVPEPATMTLLGIGLVGLAGGAVRRRYGNRNIRGYKF